LPKEMRLAVFFKIATLRKNPLEYIKKRNHKIKSNLKLHF